MAHKVVFRPSADAALEQLFAYILDKTGSPDIAIGYVRRIRVTYEGLASFPERGTLRPTMGQNVRVIGFERRVSIVFRPLPDVVEIIGIFYGGRDFANEFAEDG